MSTNQIKIAFTSVFCIIFLTFQGQEIQKDSTRHSADIKYLVNEKKISLQPKTSTLRQVAGAPKAHWNYYWELGDGNYSFEEKPKHQYQENGTYTVRLSATNNYDDGKPPLTRPKEVTINDTSNADLDTTLLEDNTSFFTNYNGFQIQNNREPSPNEDMQLIVSYANDKEHTTNGRLYVFYNEKKYKDNNFTLENIRTFHNEVEIEENYILALQKIKSKDVFIRSTGITSVIADHKIINDTLRQDLKKSLEESNQYYRSYKVWDVNDVTKNEKRNMFFTFKTTPEMLKDTSAIITIRSIYIPERGINTHKIVEKEMEIVTSHDPNKMAVYQTYLNYRLVRFKRLKYKVRFQNNGEGPARLIKLNVDIPQMLDKTTLKVIDMYPKVPMCPLGKKVVFSCMDTIIMKDKISFQFKNIYLPGTNQKGVKEKDSTKGFVKYSLKFGKDFHKKKSTSRTAIIFDKNEPIITNSSTSRFKPGISIGVKGGYSYFFDSNENLDFNQVNTNSTIDTKAKGFFLGVTISPYKSYKWYYQAEIMASSQQITSLRSHQETNDATAGMTLSKINNKTEILKNNLDIVPASIRYNFNSIFGAGLGAQFSVNGYQKAVNFTDTKVFENNNGVVGAEIRELETHHCVKNYKKGLSLNNYGLFVDLTIGVARIGPSIGIRYIQKFKEPTKQIQTYAIWKF